MTIIITQAIQLLASLVLGSNVFPKILGMVQNWAEKEIATLNDPNNPNSSRRNGVLKDIEEMGLKLSESAARLGVELAVTYLKTKAGK